jgi:hypothetical protein
MYLAKHKPIAKGKQAFVLIKREAATARRQAIGRWGIDGDASARVVMWIWSSLALDLVSEGSASVSLDSWDTHGLPHMAAGTWTLGR